MPHTLDLIRPPNYSGQNDSGIFIVINRVERGVTVPFVWDERRTFSSSVATDLHAGLVCLRLEKARPPDYPRTPHSNGAEYEELCVWRDHVNVQLVSTNDYLLARRTVRLHEYHEALRDELADALKTSSRIDGILALLPISIGADQPPVAS